MQYRTCSQVSVSFSEYGYIIGKGCKVSCNALVTRSLEEMQNELLTGTSIPLKGDEI